MTAYDVIKVFMTGPVGRALDYRSLSPKFESRRGHI